MDEESIDGYQHRGEPMRDMLVHMFEEVATFGWAVRRNWAGGGHEFVTLQPTPRAALRALSCRR